MDVKKVCPGLNMGNVELNRRNDDMPKTTKNYFTYDWKFEDKPAVYRIDLDFLECARIRVRSGVIEEKEITPLLSVIIGNRRQSVLGEKEARKIIETVQRLAAKSCSCLVGIIQCGLVLRLYLYEGDIGSLDKFSALIAAEKGFKNECVLEDEIDYYTYRRLLLPDAAKIQTEYNRENLEFLRERGDTMAPRRLNIHMAFRNEPASMDFAIKARENGFAVGVHEDTGDNEFAFGLVVYKVCALEKSEVDALTTEIIHIAAFYGGKLMFWDCPAQSVLKKR